jgi:hypothetical protein
MVIRLSVRTLVDPDALEVGVALHLIRITAAVSILTPAGWSPSPAKASLTQEIRLV